MVTFGSGSVMPGRVYEGVRRTQIVLLVLDAQEVLVDVPSLHARTHVQLRMCVMKAPPIVGVRSARPASLSVLMVWSVVRKTTA